MSLVHNFYIVVTTHLNLDFILSGVTAIRPDELELPGTMTDLDHDTWMLSGKEITFFNCWFQ